jgi:Flp pilus assembly protein TadD
MGSAFAQSGDFDRASQSYTYALLQNPDSATALIGSGLLAERNGDFELAVTQISHAMRVAPSDVGYVLLAKALHRAGRFAEADEAESRAQQISHDMTQARQSAAQVLAATGINPE